MRSSSEVTTGALFTIFKTNSLFVTDPKMSRGFPAKDVSVGLEVDNWF